MNSVTRYEADWLAKVCEGKHREFEEFFLEKAVPHVKSQPGLVSLSVGRPLPSTPDEFLMTMLWTDIESVKAFAGSEWEQAVILDDERHLIKDVFVYHYERIDLGKRTV